MKKPRQADFLVRYSLQTFAVILILGVLLRTFLFASYVASGLNMLPSLWPGDFILGAKWRVHHLSRGEVVVFRCPGEGDRTCVARVIGLAGDRIEIRGDRLWVNGESALLKTISPQIVRESVGEQSWLIWPAESTGAALEPLVIPPGQVFVMNDKRSLLEDSRRWGPIKTHLIEARALKVWLSLDWFEDEQVRAWPRIRWSRLFRSIN